MKMFNVLILIMISILVFLSISFKTLESFEESNEKMRVQTRGCEMHLTKDPELCNKLEPFYKLGNIQLQVAINKMKKLRDSSSKQAYNILRYIQSKKKQIPINSCKIEVPGLKEIDKNEFDSFQYPFKTITSFVDYDPISFKGYCLLDTNYDTDELSVKMKIDKEYSNIINSDNMQITSKVKDIDGDDTTYAALEIRSDIYSQILNNSKEFCKKNNKNIDIPDKAVFVKVTCHLENMRKISVSKVEIVEYVKNKNKFEKIKKYEENKKLPPKKDSKSEQNSNIETDEIQENETDEIQENEKDEIQENETDEIREEFTEEIRNETDQTTSDISKESENTKQSDISKQSENSKQSDISKESENTKQSDISKQSENSKQSEKVMKEFEKNFFGFTYIENSSLIFSSYNVPVKIYNFDFDICSSIQSYTTIDEITDPLDESKKSKIKLSFAEDLRISPIMIKQNLNIPFKDDTKNISESEDVKVTDNKDGDIKKMIEDKINSIEDENKDIKNKLKEYDEALDKTAKNYVNLQSLCKENQDTYSNCIDRANIDFGNLYKLITIAKTGLNDLIQRNMANKESLVNVLEVMEITKFTIEDMNQDILNNTPKHNDGSLKNKGVPISMQKFAPFVSNDDCFYFQLS